ADLECRREATEPIEEDTDYVYQSGRINPWKVELVSVLVGHYGLSFWNDVDFSSGRKVTRYKMLGRKSDITIAKYMFAWLSTECQRLCDMEAKGKGHIFAGSYCLGFVQGIAAQLKNSRAEAQKDATSSSIVKIDARGVEAERLMYRLHPNLRMSYSRSNMRYDSDALIAGKNKGKSMHLGASFGTGGTRLLSR